MVNKKVKVEECKRLTIYPLIKTFKKNLPRMISWDDGDNIAISLLSEKRSKCIQLFYKDLDYTVNLTKTKCNMGGFRYWFRCPLLQDNEKVCKRRIRVLYQPPGQDYFGCRHCYNLTYESKSRKYPLLFNLFEAKEEDGKFKRKFYAGLPTRRYSAFVDKVGKRHQEATERIALMNEKRLNGVVSKSLQEHGLHPF